MQSAKIFWTGRSQAVRLPKDYRFDTDEVSIRRRGNAVILESPGSDWSWLDAAVAELDRDFVDAATEDSPPQKRTGLDKLFR